MDKTEAELAGLAATHRRAAEEYDRQIRAKQKALEPPELPRLREELQAAKMRIRVLEDNIMQAHRALEGKHSCGDVD